MRNRYWAAPALAAAALLLAPAAASASRPAAQPHGVPGAITIDLAAKRPAFAHAKEGPVAGPTFPRGRTPKPAANLGGTCAEPDCPMTYHGGSVQTSPKIYLLFWGPNWSAETSSATYLEHYFQGLGVQPQDTWSSTSDQYAQSGGGHPSFSGTVYAGAWNDTSTPPYGATQSQLGAEADAFASGHGISGNANVNIIVATQSGTCPANFYAPSCGGTGQYCAWHSSSNEPYTNLPYLLDAGASCGENFINSGTAGVNDGWSIVGGHEYAETITDPYPDSGWIDLSDGGGGEIGDKCAWTTPDGDLALSTGSFAVQSLWSNTANACVMSTPQPADTVTVKSPGNRHNVAGGKYKLQIAGTSSGGYPLTWTATGLPAGMTIGSGTGLISGKFTTAATYTTTVTATDSAGASGHVTFTWTVAADTGTPITGYHALCLDDAGAWELVGNPVDIYTCNGSGAQKWSFSSGELHVLGLCLSDTGGSGSKVSLYNCKGLASETWTHRSNGEYVLASNGLCLTDPGSSTTLGTVQVIKTCAATANQKWSGS